MGCALEPSLSLRTSPQQLCGFACANESPVALYCASYHAYGRWAGGDGDRSIIAVCKNVIYAFRNDYYGRCMKFVYNTHAGFSATRLPRLANARKCGAIVVLDGKFLYYLGGIVSEWSVSCGRRLSLVRPKLGWVNVPNINEMVSKCEVCTFNARLIYRFCGFFVSMRIYSTKIERFDALEEDCGWHFVNLSPSKQPLTGYEFPACVQSSDRTILIFGGRHGYFNTVMQRTYFFLDTYTGELKEDIKQLERAACYKCSAPREMVWGRTACVDTSSLPPYAIVNYINVVTHVCGSKTYPLDRIAGK